MYTYRFPIDNLIGVMMHIESFGRTILSMGPHEDHYDVQLDGSIDAEQLQHLTEEYGFVESPE
jgi:hypothetical protein